MDEFKSLYVNTVPMINPEKDFKEGRSLAENEELMLSKDVSVAEVEAALDDANVIRFADYLEKLSTQTQFIVITHRKGTMEKADVLYGVTMQERGVTKLVSVRMDNVSEYMDDEK